MPTFPRGLAFLVALGAGPAFLLQGCDRAGKPEIVVGQPEPESPRVASFLVLGDWGWDPEIHGDVKTVSCQQSIADLMHEKMVELGDVRFVINVGDSFYPDGVANKTDPQWDDKWRNIYSPQVRSVPWYSVYGNHDLHMDNCTCSDDPSDCAQVNDNISNLDLFYMPNHSYFVEHPDIDLEVVALDFNWEWANHTCLYTLCPETCHEHLRRRHEKAFTHFYERKAASQAKNLVVFSHYPSDYFWGYPDFLAELGNASRHHVEFYGGHRHHVDQESCTSIAPNEAWVVGGGGGWGCEGVSGLGQGFLVGELRANGSLTTYPALVNFSVCCDPPERIL